MTYNDLLLKLQVLSQEQLACKIYIYTDSDGDYHMIQSFALADAKDEDVLDRGHPVLISNE